MEFRLLGPVTIVDGDRDVTIRQRRQRALLALLLLHLGETVAVDRILDELWGGEPPPTALASLHNAVSALRRLVGADKVVTLAPGYALEIEPTSVDTLRFEHLLGEAQAAVAVQDHDTASVVLREALSLWRGPALADLAYEPFAQAEIRRLEELRQAALEDRIDADLASGRHEHVVPELERLIADDPLRERVHGQLMLALYRSGRQADALAAYRAARQTLVDELGIEPGPDLKQLEQAILRQDASLLLAGASPVTPSAPMQFRRLATILSADALVVAPDDEVPDPETAHRLLVTQAETAHSVIARHGGWVTRTSGEALIAAFGAQAADETHALRAARAALDLQSAADSFNQDLVGLAAHLELRVGVATGEVLVSGSQARQQFVTGEAVRVASGLQQKAQAGEILIGPLARRLLGSADVEAFGELELRRRAKPVAAFRLVTLPAGDAPSAQRLEAPLVGRARQLRILRATLRESRTTGSLAALVVVGPAGIGKSRLARELARGAKGFDIVTGHCLSHGEGVTYWPLRELVGNDPAAIKEAVAKESDAASIADRLARRDGTAMEIAWAFRRWCEARAATRPILLIVDDLHWAEPTFLDLLEHLAEHGRGRIVLLGLARDELLDDRPSFLTGGRLLLEGLSTADTEALVDHLLAGAPLPSDSRARVLDAAEGNPLFLEQLVALAVEGDPLGADQHLPVTVQGLLAGRLDRLGPGERAVLERGAIVGRSFTAAQVTGLLDAEARPTATRHLASLERRGFLRTEQDDRLCFSHVLLQEATYRATPKALRATLHERFADSLDRDQTAPEVLVGYHLERAYRLHTELGPPDRRAQKLAEDAGVRLGEAGVRAWQRYDAPAAINLLRRAASLLPTTAARRLGLLCELGTVFKFVGDDAAAEAVLIEAANAATATDNRALHRRAELERCWPRYLRGEIHREDIAALAEDAIPMFEVAGDERGLARAWLLLAATRSLAGSWTACKEAARHALHHQQRSGFVGGAPISLLAASAWAGPDPVNASIQLCEELIGPQTPDATGHDAVLILLAHLEAMRGSFDVARDALRRSREFVEERGGVPWSDWIGAAATVEMLAGDPAAAESILRDGCARLAESGDRAWLATLEAALADSLYEQARYEEAAEHALRARDASPADDLTAETAWRRALAKAWARTGRAADAVDLAREALAMLETTDAVNDRSAAAVDLAEVLHLVGRHEEASGYAREGLVTMRRKGNMVGIRQARARLRAVREDRRHDGSPAVLPSSLR